MKRLLAGLAVLALTGCSWDTFSVAGTLQLDSARSERVWTAEGCPLSSGGYSDIRDGTQVTVYDASGKAVAVGALTNSLPLGKVGDRTSRCYFAFEVTGIPEGSAIYAIEVSHRGKVSLNRAALRSLLDLRIA